MRIAIVGNGRTVHALVRGGALAARGHQVRLVTAGEVLQAPGIEVRTRPLPEGPVAGVRAARGFLRDIWSFQPDVLHVHYAGNKLGTMATLSGVHPLVVTVMGGDVQPEQHAGGLPRLERRATRRLLQEADLILAKSDALRPEIARVGPFEAKTETVRWGVDPELFRARPDEASALRARLGLRADDRVILSPRLLRPLYNIHMLVDALPGLLAREPRAVVLLSEHRAEPEYKALLESRIAEPAWATACWWAASARRHARVLLAGGGLGEPAVLGRPAAVAVRGHGLRDAVGAGPPALVRGGRGRWRARAAGRPGAARDRGRAREAAGRRAAAALARRGRPPSRAGGREPAPRAARVEGSTSGCSPARAAGRPGDRACSTGSRFSCAEAGPG
jgi:glycosyltransferase involved in cell wall biosynthesis